MRSFIASLVVLSACGTQEADVEAYCATSCAKFSECEFTQFVTEEACVDTCEVQAEAAACQPTPAESNACLDAIEDATCDAFRDGLPSECDVVCDETDPGTEETGNGGGGGGGTTAPSCDELQTCCDTLEAGEKIGCEAIVNAGTELGCSVALAGFRDEGICPE